MLAVRSTLALGTSSSSGGSSGSGATSSDTAAGDFCAGRGPHTLAWTDAVNPGDDSHFHADPSCDILRARRVARHAPIWMGSRGTMANPKTRAALMPNDDQACFAAAERGEVAQLFALARLSPRVAYRWLLVARDLGHAAANDRIADVNELYDDFKYDDDGFLKMEVELEVARMYLLGNVVPADPKRGMRHLAKHVELATSALDDWTPAELDELVAQVGPEVRPRMLRWLRAEPFRIVTRRVARVQHLWKIFRTSEVPRVILEAELERLRETVAHLTAFVLPDR